MVCATTMSNPVGLLSSVRHKKVWWYNSIPCMTRGMIWDLPPTTTTTTTTTTTVESEGFFWGTVFKIRVRNSDDGDVHYRHSCWHQKGVHMYFRTSSDLAPEICRFNGHGLQDTEETVGANKNTRGKPWGF